MLPSQTATKLQTRDFYEMSGRKTFRDLKLRHTHNLMTMYEVNSLVKYLYSFPCYKRDFSLKRKCPHRLWIIWYLRGLNNQTRSAEGITNNMRIDTSQGCSITKLFFITTVEYLWEKCIGKSVYYSLQRLLEILFVPTNIWQVTLKERIKHSGLPVKCPLFLSDFNHNCNVPKSYGKTPQNIATWLNYYITPSLHKNVEYWYELYSSYNMWYFPSFPTALVLQIEAFFRNVTAAAGEQLLLEGTKYLFCKWMTTQNTDNPPQHNR